MWQVIENQVIGNKNGVTLIELIIVIAIIGILALLSAVGVEVIRSQRISNVSRELLGDLQKARMDAMTQSTANTRGFGARFASATSYTIFRFDDADTDYVYDGTGEEAATTTKNLSSSIELRVNGATPGNNILIFDRLGYPRGADWGFNNMTIRMVRVSDGAIDTSILQKCVSVSTNRIREGLWNGSSCAEQ